MTADAPIFVIGYQRSGTTLLQSLLGAHPRIAAPPETYFIFRVAAFHAYFGDLREDDRLRRALHEALNPPIPLFADCGFEEEHIFERARRSDRSYASLFSTIMDDFAARQGKARWSEKTPGQPARGVFELYPDAQAIHIVRDPRDVVASSLRMPWTPPRARVLAETWRQFTLDNIRVGLEVGPRHFLQIRYEDLTREPDAVLRHICGFLGEDFVPAMLDDPSLRRPTIATAAEAWQKDALEPVTTAKQGRWRSMPRHQQARVGAVVRHELRSLGYESPGRGDVVGGIVLNTLLRPTEVPSAFEEWRLRRARHDPERHYVEAQRYLRRRARTVS